MPDKVRTRVLVIEDEEILLKVFITYLARAGYEADFALDGKVGLEKVKTFRPNLVITDLVMPGLDGFAVIEELRRNPVTKSIPIIVISALGEPDQTERALRLGANDFLTKGDLNLAHMVEKVGEYVKP